MKPQSKADRVAQLNYLQLLAREREQLNAVIAELYAKVEKVLP